MSCFFPPGESVAFFGREYHVHSCDAFTRAWLQSEGVRPGEDSDAPSATPEPRDTPTKTPAQARTVSPGAFLLFLQKLFNFEQEGNEELQRLGYPN